MKHTSCGIEKSAIFSFSNAILAGSVSSCGLMLYSVSFQVLIENGEEIFSFLIEVKDLLFVARLYFSLKMKKFIYIKAFFFLAK